MYALHQQLHTVSCKKNNYIWEPRSRDKRNSINYHSLWSTGVFISPIPTTLGSMWLEVLIPKWCKVLPRENDEKPIELQAMVDTWALRLFVLRNHRKWVIILTGKIDNNQQEVVGFLSQWEQGGIYVAPGDSVSTATHLPNCNDKLKRPATTMWKGYSNQGFRVFRDGLDDHTTEPNIKAISGGLRMRGNP